MNTQTQGLSFNEAAHIARELQNEIGKAVSGQWELIDQVLITLLAGGHTLMEGVPGLGKTLLAKALAKTFDGGFSRIQFTPDLVTSDITGQAIYDTQTQRFRFFKGPIFSNLLLADQINRAPARTQAALLEVMQERQVTLHGQKMTLAQPVTIFATQNPIEFEGTYPLPEALLDRFLLKIQADYPSEEDEKALVLRATFKLSGDLLDVSTVNTITQPATIQDIQRIVSNLTVDSRVYDYAVRIVRKTREWPGVSTGAGPRGGIALIRAARSRALLLERDFVTPDDVKAVALPCLRHRLVLAPELEIEGQRSDGVITAILDNLQAPRS
jgi:MoxR-like ATPase